MRIFNYCVGGHIAAGLIISGLLLSTAPVALAEPGKSKSGESNPGAVIVANTPAADKANAGKGGRGSDSANQAVAGHDGDEDSEADGDDDNGVNAGNGIPTTFFAGVNAGGGDTGSYLRLLNSGNKSGAAVVQIYDVAGAQLASWSSPTVLANGSLEVGAADIAAGASPALTAAQVGQTLSFVVTANFKGTAQHIGRAGGSPINLSSCGPKLEAVGRAVGSVAGPGNTGLIDAIRIVNPGSQSRNVSLTLYLASDGTSLGTWTSPQVPARGNLTIAVADIAGASVTAARLTIVADHLGSGVRIEHLSRATAGGSISDLSTACRLQSSAAAQHTDGSNDSGDDTSEDDDGEVSEDDSADDQSDSSEDSGTAAAAG